MPLSSSKSDPKPGTKQTWTHEFETLRRQDLFQNPPKDRTAYPALQAAIAPHIQSFNAVFEKGGLLSQALRDIGTKTFFDGDERTGPAGKNRLNVRIKEIIVEKPQLSHQNKVSTRNRKILPAECRERHCTYRGRMYARLEYWVNDGDRTEMIRDIGKLPLMLMVRIENLWTWQEVTDQIIVKQMPSREQHSCRAGSK
jgi:DNA-directed RNA polymerase I subunit RPA2